MGPTTPTWQRRRAIPPGRFRLFRVRSPLLTESLLLSIPRGTEMFQFPRFPLPALCVQAGVTLHDECRVSPFGHPRIRGWSAPTRGFSQPPTSFIGSCRQGIHRWPFVAWDFTHKDARARYEILKDRRPAESPGRGGRALRARANLHNGREDGPRVRAPVGASSGPLPASASTGCPSPFRSWWTSRMDLDSLERR